MSHLVQQQQQGDEDLTIGSKNESTNQNLNLSKENWSQYTIQTIRQIQKSTPLTFHLSINQNFYISYPKQHSKQQTLIIESILIPKFLCIFFIFVFMDILLVSLENISKSIKFALFTIQIIMMILFLLLSYLDPGTVCEDQDEQFQQQRIYCSVCGYYRLQTTRHCVFCNRCVKKYDHHCTFFSKCIGQRNICFFWLFLIATITAIVGNFMVLLISLISTKMPIKNL